MTKASPVEKRIINHVALYYPFKSMDWIARDLGVSFDRVRRTVTAISQETQALARMWEQARGRG